MIRRRTILAGASAAAAATAAAAPGTPVPGSWIVTLREGADNRGVAARYQADPRYTYSAALNGFAGLLLDTVVRGRREVRRLAYLQLPAPGNIRG